MNYKELLESGEPVYHETARFRHMKNAVLSERYFSNYLSYKKNPDLLELQTDLAYLEKEQADYAEDYAFLFFAENTELSENARKELELRDFSLFKHLILTNQVDRLQLKQRDVDGIRIVKLDESYLDEYLQVKYQEQLVYGETYADQMRTENAASLLHNGSTVYLALFENQIVGDVTAWFFGEYVEIDDFHVRKDFRGRGIGTMLQQSALKERSKVILIAEEENLAMYQHQGYQEVAWYWVALRSNTR